MTRLERDVQAHVFRNKNSHMIGYPNDGFINCLREAADYFDGRGNHYIISIQTEFQEHNDDWTMIVFTTDIETNSGRKRITGQ